MKFSSRSLEACSSARSPLPACRGRCTRRSSAAPQGTSSSAGHLARAQDALIRYRHLGVEERPDRRPEVLELVDRPLPRFGVGVRDHRRPRVSETQRARPMSARGLDALGGGRVRGALRLNVGGVRPNSSPRRRLRFRRPSASRSCPPSRQLTGVHPRAPEAVAPGGQRERLGHDLPEQPVSGKSKVAPASSLGHNRGGCGSPRPGCGAGRRPSPR